MAMLLCLGLVGCADTWVKPGATPQQFAEAKVDCDRRALFRLPPDIRQRKVSDAYIAPSSTTCTHSRHRTDCITIPEHYVAATYAEFDTTSSGRDGLIRSCLLEKSWVPERRR